MRSKGLPLFRVTGRAVLPIIEGIVFPADGAAAIGGTATADVMVGTDGAGGPKVAGSAQGQLAVAAGGDGAIAAKGVAASGIAPAAQATGQAPVAGVGQAALVPTTAATGAAAEEDHTPNVLVHGQCRVLVVSGIWPADPVRGGTVAPIRVGAQVDRDIVMAGRCAPVTVYGRWDVAA